MIGEVGVVAIHGVDHPCVALVDAIDARSDGIVVRRQSNNFPQASCIVVGEVPLHRVGRQIVGKAQIRRAMEEIAAHFDRTLDVRQDGMVILESADTALVLAKTLVSAKNFPLMERKATYVFRKDASGRWLCVIDSSYGHEVLDARA